MSKELVKRFQAVKPQIRGLRVDKDTDIGRGTLTIGTSIIDFNKDAYLAKDLTPTQRAWGEALDANDGFVPVVLTTEPSKDVPSATFPFNVWLSVLKGIDGIIAKGDKLEVAAGKKYRVVAGTLMVA